MLAGLNLVLVVNVIDEDEIGLGRLQPLPPGQDFQAFLIEILEQRILLDGIRLA